MWNFSGRTALVTGAAQGIGRAIGLCLAKSGARVAVNYRHNEVEAAATVAMICDGGGIAKAYRADLAEMQDVIAMCRSIEGELGPVELLVNNAGWFSPSGANEDSPENLENVLRANLRTAYVTTWVVKDPMLARGFGRIVNVASTGAFFRVPGQNISYGAAKAAVIALTKGWAGAWASRNIRVNCVAPGFVNTEANLGLDPAMLERVIQQTPLQRGGEPKEIADAVAFLLSENSAYINGQTIAVCGGRVMLP